jgi:hypothetical protein
MPRSWAVVSAVCRSTSDGGCCRAARCPVGEGQWRDTCGLILDVSPADILHRARDRRGGNHHRGNFWAGSGENGEPVSWRRRCYNLSAGPAALRRMTAGTFKLRRYLLSSLRVLPYYAAIRWQPSGTANEPEKHRRAARVGAGK